MNLYKELFDFLEANNWLSLEDEENAKGVISSYIKVYKPELHQGQLLPIDSVSKCCNTMCDEPVHKEGSVYCEFHKDL